MFLFLNLVDSVYINGYYEQFVIDSVGVYIFGYVVGYGLFFQFMGDIFYVDLGC